MMSFWQWLVFPLDAEWKLVSSEITARDVSTSRIDYS